MSELRCRVFADFSQSIIIDIMECLFSRLVLLRDCWYAAQFLCTHLKMYCPTQARFKFPALAKHPIWRSHPGRLKSVSFSRKLNLPLQSCLHSVSPDHRPGVYIYRRDRFWILSDAWSPGDYCLRSACHFSAGPDIADELDLSFCSTSESRQNFPGGIGRRKRKLRVCAGSFVLHRARTRKGQIIGSGAGPGFNC